MIYAWVCLEGSTEEVMMNDGEREREGREDGVIRKEIVACCLFVHVGEGETVPPPLYSVFS